MRRGRDTRGSLGGVAAGVYRDPRQRRQDALDCTDGQQGTLVNMSTLLANLSSTEIFLLFILLKC